MAELTSDEIDALASRLLTAIVAGDTEGVRACYAPGARIWHNFDEYEQTVDENLATLADLHRRATGLDYTEIQRYPAPGGFVQQHILVGAAIHGALRVPAIIRFWVDPTEPDRITRLEEYLDTRQARVLYRT